MNYGNVGVYIQHNEGKIEAVSLELLSKASSLANILDTKVSAYIACTDSKDYIKTLYSYGADFVYTAENKSLDFFKSVPYTTAIVELIKKDNPYIVLFGASREGRDIAPRVASSMGSGLTADCTELKIGDFKDAKTNIEYKNLLYQIRPAFGGNIIATIINPIRHPQMATVREGVMKLRQADFNRTGKHIKVDLDIDEKDNIKIISREIKIKKVNLTGANIIVSGGMGVGSTDNFNKLKELSKLLGAELGASRAAVDQGWVEKDHQVGQTGVTVRPKLYIAFGISGSIQHKAGMDGALKIIAVNNDANAPIMDFAHVKIVGDLNKVIPMMIESYKTLEL